MGHSARKRMLIAATLPVALLMACSRSPEPIQPQSKIEPQIRSTSEPTTQTTTKPAASRPASTASDAAASTKSTARARTRPVTPGTPARVFVMAGYTEACEPVAPSLKVKRPPSSGKVTFRPGQTTTLRSGPCAGRKMTGTGIYFTAALDAKGTDSFSVEARVADREPVEQSFTVTIVSDDPS